MVSHPNSLNWLMQASLKTTHSPNFKLHSFCDMADGVQRQSHDLRLHFGVASLTSPVAKGCGKWLEELNHEYKPWNWVPAISGSALEIGWAQLFRRGTELLFLNIKRSQFKWFGYVTACLLGAFRSGVCGLAHWEGTQGQTLNILERLRLSEIMSHKGSTSGGEAPQLRLWSQQPRPG